MTWNPLKPLSLNWCLTSKRAIHLDTQQPENWNRKEHTGLWDTPVKWQSHRTCLLSAHGKVFSGNWSPAGCYKKSEQAAEWSQQQVWFHWLQGAYSRRGKQAEKEYERCKAEYDREKPNWTNSMTSKRLQEQRHSNIWRTVVRTYTVKAAFSGYIEEIHSWREAAGRTGQTNQSAGNDRRATGIFQHEITFAHSWGVRRRTVRRNFRTGFLCQYESSPLQL